MNPGPCLWAEWIFEDHVSVMRDLVVEVKKTLQLVLRDLGEYANLKDRASGPVASALLIAVSTTFLVSEMLIFYAIFIFLTYILCLIALYICATVGYVDD